MSDPEPTRPIRAPWVHSVFNHARKVARPTLSALNNLLGGGPSDPAMGVHRIQEPLARSEVDLATVPDLAEIGGVARIETADHSSIAIARVGRNSFVGYRLDEAGLAEVPIELDDSAGTLRIGGE